MSQWGATREVAGVRVLPLVGGLPWTPAAPGSRIECLFCVHCAEEVDRQPIIDALERRFVGRPYSEWLAWQPDAVQLDGSAEAMIARLAAEADTQLGRQ